jgi:hypothetical protein
MSRKMMSALLILVLCAGSAAAESLIDPYKGTWRLNYDLSYMRALADENLPQRDPAILAKYIGTMARIIELSIEEEGLRYTRGRHDIDMSYEIVGMENERLVLSVKSDQAEAVWEMALDEQGYLHMYSSATRLNDFYVYERGEIPRDENGLPLAFPKQPTLPNPMGKDGSSTPPTGQPSNDDG